MAEEALKGIFITTSFFTQQTIDFVKKKLSISNRWQSLHDLSDIIWCLLFKSAKLDRN